MDINHPSRIRLTHENLFSLQPWLTTNKEILTQHTFRTLAEKATVDLGFEISYSSIDRISKLLKIPAGLPPTQSRKVVSNADADILALAQILQIVLNQMGMQKSPILIDIITRLKAEQ